MSLSDLPAVDTALTNMRIDAEKASEIYTNPPGTVVLRTGASVKNLRQILAELEGMGASLYDSTAIGLTNTADGDLFMVKGSGDVFAYLYKNVSDVAVDQNISLPSSVYVDAVALAQQESVVDTRLFHESQDEVSQIPTKSSDNILITADGYALLRRENSIVYLGTAQFDIDGGFSPFKVTTADGTLLFSVEESGAVSFSGLSQEIEPFTVYQITTKDGYTLLDFDSVSGGLRCVLSANRYEMGGDYSNVPGLIGKGVITNISYSGEKFSYSEDSGTFSGRVIGNDTTDWTAPHLGDTPSIDVVEADGQSWQTISDYTPDETEFEDTTGETARALSNMLSPLVTTLRKQSYAGVTVPDSDYSAQVPTISNGTIPENFHRFDPSQRFSISQAAILARTIFNRRFNLPTNSVLALNVGWPGTSSEKFLPEGSSYTYTDDFGASQTTTAVSHPDAGDYLWARNILMRNYVAQVIKNKWFSKPINYRFLTWIQGPFDDYGNALGFMSEYRTQQDQLVFPDQSTISRDILWDQNGGRTDRTLQPNGVQAQLEFCQSNISGKDWLVGPRYPHKMRDAIHHSSFGALEYAERTGQAMAYIQHYGDWQPLWISSVSFSGTDCIIQTNAPRQCIGDLILDVESISPAANHGFTLWDVTGDTEINITSVSIVGETITLSTSSPISGEVEVGYAVRGPAPRSTGTVAAPEHAATWGNVKMLGRDSPAIIPTYVQPTLDHWLCSYKKEYTV